MLQLYLIKEPERTLILVSNEFVLTFKKTTNNNQNSSVIVDFLPINDVDLIEAILLYDISGLLGLLDIGGYIFLTVITSSSTLGSNSQSFKGAVGNALISVIRSVEFVCLDSNIFDTLSTSSLDAATDSYDDVTSVSRAATEAMEYPYAGVRRILSNGHFYFSSTGNGGTDISTRLEKRLEREGIKSQGKSNQLEDSTEETQEEFDPRFLWNGFLISSLLAFRASCTPSMRSAFDRQSFIALAIQGYCGVYDLNIAGEPAVLTVISRLSSSRAGTRFAVRGIDDHGNTANFVETETILRTPSMCFSYVQIRGSVPVFWEETGLPFGLKITITRPIESSLPAFLRHFESLIDNYSSLHIVNLLSSKDQEVLLTEAYQAHLAASKLIDEEIKENVFMTNFDFHARSRVGGIESIKTQLASVVGAVEERFGACLVAVDSEGQGSLIVGQRGVFRTNCKDCLDRTGVVQDVLSRFALEDFIKNANPHWVNSDQSLWSAHRVLFAENGDSLSKMYAGTGALNTSFTRSGKKSFAGLLSDASKSVGRMYQSTFLDVGKQAGIDALLGQLSTLQKVRVFNPVNDALRIALKSRESEYTTSKSVSIYVGTYNLNGKGPSSESLLPWLFPTSDESDIIVLAFQELVPLTATMILSTDPEKKKKWEAHILDTLANRSDKKSDYILLRSGQLVGTALLILVKTSIVENIRNVEVATKKTGLKGMAGNKGAVAIRLDYCDSSFCFLTAHLAAGHSAIEERNADYFTISEGLHFSKGKKLSNHDNIIWAADTNYRISLPNEQVRQLAESDDYSTLLEADQLLSSKRTSGVFAGFSEGPLLFRPTYKYDNGTQVYDTSEKARIPAWTDRILYYGKELDLSRYNRAELMASDHRPVYATLRARIKIIDQLKRASLRKTLLSEIKVSGVGTIASDTKLLRSMNSLPPPSDDDQSWFDAVKLPPSIDSSLRNLSISNPFEEGYISPTPARQQSHSIRTPLSNSTFRSVPPPPPARNQLPEAASKIQPPPIPRRPAQVPISSNVDSLLDEDEESSLKSWEVLKA